MGYDVHITRRNLWSDGGGISITEQEWLTCASTDPTLAPLVWNHGNIDAKNPDHALVLKMVSVAADLGATVQGDDGEFYDSEGTPVQRKTGLLSRAISWVRNRASSGAKRVAPSSLPFKVGDRVRDSWGNVGSVTSIDVGAEHGLGRITVKFQDGRTLHWAAHAHGLERVDA